MLRRAKCATNLWFWCLYVLTVKIKIFIVTGNGNTHFDLRSCPASMKSGHKYLSLNNSFSRFKIFILFLLQRIQNLFVISLKLRFFLVICNYFWNYKYYILFLYEFQWLIVEILSFLGCCGLFILTNFIIRIHEQYIFSTDLNFPFICSRAGRKLSPLLFRLSLLNSDCSLGARTKL